MMTRIGIAMTSPMTMPICQTQCRPSLLTKTDARIDKPDQRRILLCLF